MKECDLEVMLWEQKDEIRELKKENKCLREVLWQVAKTEWQLEKELKKLGLSLYEREEEIDCGIGTI